MWRLDNFAFKAILGDIFNESHHYYSFSLSAIIHWEKFSISFMEDTTTQIENIQEVNDFLSTVLTNLHSSVFVLSGKRTIRSANKSGLALLGKNEKAIINQLFGNALDCMNTEGDSLKCGFSPYCKDCRLLSMVRKIFEDNQPVIKDVFDRKNLEKNNGVIDKYFLYSARAIRYEGEKMVLLIVDDITEGEKQKRYLEEKNEEVYSSIRYAKTIQTSLLPSNQEMKAYLGEHFVMYFPQDVIGGDFYWMTRIYNVTGNTTVVAVADCTGHGIHGALLSMLGIYTLNDIVKGQKETAPDKILNYLREQLVNNLNRSKSSSFHKGMDIGICAIEDENQTIHFAGANQKMFHVTQQNLYEINGNKIPMSLFDRDKDFETQTINYQKNDMIYMFSDGYKDQFGGEEDKKFGKKKFKRLIKGISSKNVDVQKGRLEHVFRHWKRNEDQVDDVTVLGIRLT